MRFWFISRHLPASEGTAAGRILLATVEGLRSAGHQVTAWSWGPEPPAGPLPGWCEWRPLPLEPAIVHRSWSLVRPRDEVRRAGHPRPEPGTVAVADDPISFPGVAGEPHSTVTVHYLPRLDDRALGNRSASAIQARRAMRRWLRQAHLVLCYSPRLAGAVARGVYVPCAYPIPARPVPPVEDPISVVVADWAWAPNRVAADRLLAAWPGVRERVTGARLVLAGRSSELLSVGAMGGVEVRGEVPSSAELLGEAAVVPFPCPSTSGPKVKVLEALSLGLPVVTTEPGVEGVEPGAQQGCVVADGPGFAAAWARLLADPSRRARLGAAARSGMADGHAPGEVARRRAEVTRARFADLPSNGEGSERS